MSDTSLHHGGCHCGAVRYSVELDTSAKAIVCDCSICRRSGTMLSFVPTDKFTLQTGEDNLSDYTFNKQVVHHLFCKTCGVRSFARGTGPQGPMIAINVRCIDDIDVFAVPTMQHRGKDM